MALFGFLGKALGAAGSLVTSVIPGTLDDKLFSVIDKKILRPQATPTLTTATQNPIIRRTTGPGVPSVFPSGLPSPDSIKVTGGSVTVGGKSLIDIQKPGATAYFGAPGMTGVSSGSSSTARSVCEVGSGSHLNKSSYFLKSGEFVPARSRCVKNRRKNPLNPRALSRAMSRLASAKRAAKALDRFEVKGRRCR